MAGQKITVLGIGNLLLKDEGVGIHVIEALKHEKLPENVELVDGASAGFDLLPVVQNCARLIVIDAIKTKDKPGTIYKFTPEDIQIKKELDVSLHDVDFFQVIELAKKSKTLPPTKMIAIVPDIIELGMELSDILKGKLQKLVSLVKEEIIKQNS